MKKEPVVAAVVPATRRPAIDAVTEGDAIADSRVAFEAVYKAWIAAQIELVDRVGVFGEDLRPW